MKNLLWELPESPLGVVVDEVLNVAGVVGHLPPWGQDRDGIRPARKLIHFIWHCRRQGAPEGREHKGSGRRKEGEENGAEPEELLFSLGSLPGNLLGIEIHEEDSPVRTLAGHPSRGQLQVLDVDRGGIFLEGS
jgi:hypothetical protein